MPGRNDFGILRSSLISDDRAHEASELYVKYGLAVEDTALATVAGHITMLGLHAMRETDNGILPGDGVTFVHAATLMPRSVCRTVIQALSEAHLLRPADGGGWYLVGFNDSYGPIISARVADREAKKLKREEAEAMRAERASNLKQKKVVTVSDGHPPDVPPTSPRCRGVPSVPSVPFRTEPPRSETRAEGGGGVELPSAPPDEHQLRGARAMIAVLLADSKLSQERRNDAKAVLRKLDDGSASSAEVTAFSTRNFNNPAARIAYLAKP